jgi:hypothetical protein
VLKVGSSLILNCVPFQESQELKTVVTSDWCMPFLHVGGKHSINLLIPPFWGNILILIWRTVFTLVTACQNLQSLHLTLDDYHAVRSPLQLPGFKESLIAVQGLRKLTIDVVESRFSWGTSKEQLEDLRDQVQAAFKERLMMPRSKT